MTSLRSRPTRSIALAVGLALLLAGTRAGAELPAEPSEAKIFDDIGVPGGELRTLVGSNRDTRLLVVYGYARLVGYDRQLELVPDILGSLEIEDNRVFTFGLRQGHRWSDGEPFTTEDFRYYWEDVSNNPALSPSGPRQELLVDGEMPLFEVIDDTTIRYSWSKPNKEFLPALAGAPPEGPPA